MASMRLLRDETVIEEKSVTNMGRIKKIAEMTGNWHVGLKVG